MTKYDPAHPPPRPPAKLWDTELVELLNWYETNLCDVNHCDPRGKIVKFSTDRFPHMIKLLNSTSREEVPKAQKEVLAIREGRKRNSDYGGYDLERAQTLSWIPVLIREPTIILKVAESTLWGKPGDTLIVKEFDKKGYRQKVLVCRSVGENLLVPVTCYPIDKKRFGKSYKIVWPDVAKATS